ncbi:MAG: OmpA family protein [Pseudotabrizicola sp.]|jgi:peptidoglycan-associated lipoprotein|uniref:OmpA family protein n=1 Tax=Pseudotabrizicola sp. TaxID=2939647 RepID=UPI00272141F1|nr:OmpA family protein [Pseudotabrizicola sp.]MDO8881562.1 OmpA family protein [Pseudotabrizicola sp.]MDP2081655.1 OmpA family protein [Pseudotabrizicola sp.]MDZ7574005.1 OmpA family protein [Pseudotabrizicola sp.]
MRVTSTALVTILLSTALASCTAQPGFDKQLGYEVDEGGFGAVTRNNTGIMAGEIDAMQQLNVRFRAEVPSTVTFAFNSAELTPEARRVLAQQANWIRQFPELRFSVYGHTDLVGSNSYNQALGKRRAQAVVSFFASQGISRNRLEALVSFGKTRPVVATSGPEQANRRTVTEVAGFHKRSGTLLNGKYAEVIFREYVAGAVRPHPANTVITTSVNPAD